MANSTIGAPARDAPAEIRRAADALDRGDASGAAQILRHYLMASGASVPPPVALDAFERLLEALCYAGRHGELTDAFQAPWSPVRGLCEREFDVMYAQSIAAAGQHPLPLARRQRFHAMVAQLRASAAARGEIAECGCFRGMSSHLICRVLEAERGAFDGSGFHVIDSFQGLSAPVAEDRIPEDHPRADALREMCRAGTFAAPVEKLRKAIRQFPGVAVHAGWIPEVLSELPRAAYRFVHLDVDLYRPTLDGLAFFFPLLAPGGVIVSDDFSWPGARRAIEEFSAERGISFSVTPFGQAVISRR
jgi:hypothetical protein